MKPLAWLLLFVVTACTPSAQAVQTAIAATQASWTPTAQPPTPEPVPTSIPCTDRGWQAIAGNLYAGDNAQDVSTLENLRREIIAENVDSCTEPARQIIVAALTREIETVNTKATSWDSNIDAARRALYEWGAIKAARQDTLIEIQLANAELGSLGITLAYP